VNLNNSFSVIIVTWNALHHLKTFLPSVINTNYPDFEIIIADNASSDETALWIKQLYPQCKIVTYDNNYGYARGNNLAVKYAKNDILVFLNNDVKPDPGWLTELNHAFTKTNSDIIQPKILSYTQPGYFEYAGAAGGMIDKLGYPFCRGRLFDHIEKDRGQYNTSIPIFWASGAAFAIKKELFVNAGGFDEEFEFHMEEIDLCWRCLKMGSNITVYPSSVVYHLGGGSLPSDSARKTYYNYRNSLMMLLKNLDSYIIPKILFRLILDGFSGIRELIRGKPKSTMAIIAAHLSFYTKLNYCLMMRKRISELITRKTPEKLVYQRLIIVDFFIRKRKRYSDLINK
jgi:GT2 family glycosyltransferase